MVRVLSSKGLTLNRDKCQFRMSHLVFMAHVLSARGIGPADVKSDFLRVFYFAKTYLWVTLFMEK